MIQGVLGVVFWSCVQNWKHKQRFPSILCKVLRAVWLKKSTRFCAGKALELMKMRYITGMLFFLYCNCYYSATCLIVMRRKVICYLLFCSMTGVGGRPELIIIGSNSLDGPWEVRSSPLHYSASLESCRKSLLTGDLKQFASPSQWLKIRALIALEEFFEMLTV